ncbi:MAG: hypothetical protein RBT34_06965 [Anaerolineaceae bacterium]|nr:hypothetical protein [Anaerolineaceae bacterium]
MYRKVPWVRIPPSPLESTADKCPLESTADKCLLDSTVDTCPLDFNPVDYIRQTDRPNFGRFLV